MQRIYLIPLVLWFVEKIVEHSLEVFLVQLNSLLIEQDHAVRKTTLNTLLETVNYVDFHRCGKEHKTDATVLGEGGKHVQDFV